MEVVCFLYESAFGGSGRGTKTLDDVIAWINGVADRVQAEEEKK